jgi:hypothetical protein
MDRNYFPIAQIYKLFLGTLMYFLCLMSIVNKHLRQNFWIISPRSVVRKILHQCLQSFKVKPSVMYPIMGNLPKCRTNQTIFNQWRRLCRAYLHQGMSWSQ